MAANLSHQERPAVDRPFGVTKVAGIDLDRNFQPTSNLVFVLLTILADSGYAQSRWLGNAEAWALISKVVAPTAR